MSNLSAGEIEATLRARDEFSNVVTSAMADAKTAVSEASAAMGASFSVAQKGAADLREALRNATPKEMLSAAVDVSNALHNIGGAANLTVGDLKAVNVVVDQAIQKFIDLHTAGTPIPGFLSEMSTEVKGLIESSKGVTQSLDHVKPAAEGVGFSIGNMAKGFVLAQLGIQSVESALSTVVGFLQGSIGKFIEAEGANLRLSAAIKASGQSATLVLPQYQKLGEKFAQTTVFEKDAITSTQSLLTMMGKVLPQDMEKALEATTNLASGMGIDLTSAAMRLARGLDDGGAGLSRYGINVDKAAFASKGMIAVFDTVNAQFSGQAQAQMDSYGGHVAMLGKSWNELKESVGKFLAETEQKLGILQRLTTEINNVTAALNADPVKDYADALNHLQHEAKDATPWLMIISRLLGQGVQLGAGAGALEMADALKHFGQDAGGHALDAGVLAFAASLRRVGVAADEVLPKIQGLTGENLRLVKGSLENGIAIDVVTAAYAHLGVSKEQVELVAKSLERQATAAKGAASVAQELAAAQNAAAAAMIPLTEEQQKQVANYVALGLGEKTIALLIGAHVAQVGVYITTLHERQAEADKASAAEIAAEMKSVDAIIKGRAKIVEQVASDAVRQQDITSNLQFDLANLNVVGTTRIIADAQHAHDEKVILWTRESEKYGETLQLMIAADQVFTDRAIANALIMAAGIETHTADIGAQFIAQFDHIEDGIPVNKIVAKAKEASAGFKDAWKQMSAELPGVIQRAFEGGGNVWAAIGASAGAAFLAYYQKYLQDHKAELAAGASVPGSVKATGIAGAALSGGAAGYAATGGAGGAAVGAVGGAASMAGTMVGGIGGAALGGAGAGLQAGLVGYQAGKAGGTTKGVVSGALTGAATGFMVGGPIGAGVGAIIGGIGGWLGGKKKKAEEAQALKDAQAALAEQYGGMEKLDKLALSVGVDITRAFAKGTDVQYFNTIVADLNTKLKETDDRLKGLATASAGLTTASGAFASILNASPRGQALTKLAEAKATQADATTPKEIKISAAQVAEATKAVAAVKVTPAQLASFQNLGAYSMATFGGMIKDGKSAVEAMLELKPTTDMLTQAQQVFGLKADATTQRLLDISKVVTVNADVFQSISGLQQVMGGLGQAGALTADLFQRFGADAGANMATLQARGVDANAAMALMQPTLQQLWEGQGKYGNVTDQTTAKILKEAEQQGIVGEGMKSVNQQILDVLISIASVFGAKIPEGIANTQSALAPLPADVLAVGDAALDSSGKFDALKQIGVASYKDIGLEADTTTGKFGDLETAGVTAPTTIEARFLALQTQMALNKGDMDLQTTQSWPNMQAAGVTAGDMTKASHEALRDMINEVNTRLSKTDWAGWKKDGIEAADAVFNHIQAINVGHSPGGLKEMRERLQNMPWDEFNRESTRPLATVFDRIMDITSTVQDLVSRMGSTRLQQAVTDRQVGTLLRSVGLYSRDVEKAVKQQFPMSLKLPTAPAAKATAALPADVAKLASPNQGGTDTLKQLIAKLGDTKIQQAVNDRQVGDMLRTIGQYSSDMEKAIKQRYPMATTDAVRTTEGPTGQISITVNLPNSVITSRGDADKLSAMIGRNIVDKLRREIKLPTTH